VRWGQFSCTYTRRSPDFLNTDTCDKSIVSPFLYELWRTPQSYGAVCFQPCPQSHPQERFEVLTAMKKSMLFFWVVTPCGLAGRYQRFGQTYYLHLRGWRWWLSTFRRYASSPSSGWSEEARRSSEALVTKQKKSARRNNPEERTSKQSRRAHVETTQKSARRNNPEECTSKQPRRAHVETTQKSARRNNPEDGHRLEISSPLGVGVTGDKKPPVYRQNGTNHILYYVFKLTYKNK
jgi:hypothetical protein